ncbi:MAG: hypothetical protein H6819_08850 [Phycisphaerales bacterium]|nr:hypothetical protein [Phycisphaerales bacterium]MCB9855663.1 hypothetical protein [Phycisphaerales bacterium]
MSKPWIIAGIVLAVFVFGFFTWALGEAKTGRVAQLKIRFFSIWFPELREFTSLRVAARNWHDIFLPRVSVWLIRGFVPWLAITLAVIFLSGWQQIAIVAPILFFPVVIAVALTVDRKRIREHLRLGLLFKGVRLCTCGYNLRDNQSGICPECGAKA